MIQSPDPFPGSNPYGGEDMPVCFREKKDTVQGNWRPRIVSTRPPEIPATDLSRTSIARMSLPPDERAARREDSPHTTRRAPFHNAIDITPPWLEDAAAGAATIACILVWTVLIYAVAS